MNDGLILASIHKWSNLIISILWIVISVIMLACLVSGIVAGNPLLICVALFAFGIDGVNAYIHFRTYLTYRKIMKELKNTGVKCNEK